MNQTYHSATHTFMPDGTKIERLYGVPAPTHEPIRRRSHESATTAWPDGTVLPYRKPVIKDLSHIAKAALMDYIEATRVVPGFTRCTIETVNG